MVMQHIGGKMALFQFTPPNVGRGKVGRQCKTRPGCLEWVRSRSFLAPHAKTLLALERVSGSSQ
jgi:hypothetical protein